MVMVKEIDFKKECSTSVVSGLDKQIIDEMNRIVPNALVSFADLNIKAGQAAHLLLQPPAKEALKRAIQARGETLVVNSDYRTIAQQLLLYRQWKQGKCGIPIAARPGRSNHQSGCALDIRDSKGWKPFLEAQGWQWYGSNDTHHFDFMGRGKRDIRGTAVLAFQRLWNRNNPLNRIGEDGIYGDETEKKLIDSPSEGFQIGTGNSPLSGGVQPLPKNDSDFSRILRVTQPLMKGDDIRKVQEALVKANIQVDIDSLFGTETAEAVKQFQQREGLIADGVVGSATLAELGL